MDYIMTEIKKKKLLVPCPKNTEIFGSAQELKAHLPLIFLTISIEKKNCQINCCIPNTKEYTDTF